MEQLENLFAETLKLSEDNSLPAWYLIKEITITDFVKCCESIYSIIENKHKSKSIEDPFIKSVICSKDKITDIQWEILEKSRLVQKVLEMKIGDFHEELMGKFPDYETYPNGHITQCDVGSKDGTVVIEVKNKYNTIKGSDGKHIVKMLKSHSDNGKTAILA